MTDQVKSAVFATAPAGNTLPALMPLDDFSRVRPNLGRGFVQFALSHPQLVAIEDDRESVTYQDLLKRTIALALYLKEQLGSAERVGVILPPSVPGATVNIALTLLGKVAVNVNYGTGQAVVDYTLADSGLEYVISSPAFLAGDRLKLTVNLPVLDIGQIASELRDASRQASARDLEALPPAELFAYLATELPGLAATLDMPATVLYTSGSSGDGKGVVLSQRSILTNVQAIAQQFPSRVDDQDKPVREVILGSLTFAHSLGFTGTLWAALLLGYKAVYLANPLDLSAVCAAVEKQQVSIFVTAPTLMRLYLRKATSEQFASVFVILLGSEKLRPELRRDIKAKLGKDACEAYGATETGPIITLSVPRKIKGARGELVWGSRENSVGLPVAGTEIAIVDTETGALVKEFGPGYQGEIWVKGAQRMDYYLNKPEATAKAIVEAWYRTGDLGWVDEDGFLYVTGRLARFAKLGAEKVPLDKLESLICEISGEDERSVHVTYVSDPAKGEKLVVFYTSLGALDPATVVAALGEKVNPLWVPKASDFVTIEKMPVGPTGKTDMRALKDMAAARFI